MQERPMGIVVALVGALGLAIAAFANPLGIGETEVFGWLQITGVIVGGLVTLLGLAMAMEWVPYPARRTDTASQNTTVIKDSSPRHPTP
jgi:hypothetical protein